MPTLPVFPSSLMREGSVLWETDPAVISGGRTVTGLQTMARFDGGGLWIATMNDVPLVTADQVRAWRALTAICAGGFQPIVVPMCDKRFFPAPIVDGERYITHGSVPHGDDAEFSDGSGYEGDVVQAVLAEDADLRATSIVIDLNVGEPLRGGEHFSIYNEIYGWRLYRIMTAVLSGSNYACTIDPPLRRYADAGAPLDFDHPRCVMRIATPRSMHLMLEQRKFGQPSVSFVEALPPFPE